MPDAYAYAYVPYVMCGGLFYMAESLPAMIHVDRLRSNNLDPQLQLQLQFIDLASTLRVHIGRRPRKSHSLSYSLQFTELASTQFMLTGAEAEV